MKRYYSLLTAFALFGLLLTSGCRRAPGRRLAVVSADTVFVRPLPPADPVAATPAIEVQEITFRYLTLRSRLSYQSNTGPAIDNASVLLKARQDSVIWINVSVLGIPGARALLTRQEVIVLDLIKKTYAQYDYASLSQRYGMPLTFEVLQALLLGNLPFGQVPWQARREAHTWVLRQQIGPVRADTFIDSTDFRVRRLEAIQDLTNHTLRVSFDQFTPLEGTKAPFPMTVLLALTLQTTVPGQPNQVTVDLRHQRVELTDEPQTFPFRIPASYERTN